MQKIYVVTGSNKGIGLGIVRALAEKLPQKETIIYLTARNPTLGEAALKGQPPNVVFHQLDITNEQSCQKFAEHLQQKHGGLDVLVNNAGIIFLSEPNGPPEPAVAAEKTIETNYYGTKRISQYLIRSEGRIVHIASLAGIMASPTQNGITCEGVYKNELIEQFKRPDYSIEDIDNFVEQFKKLSNENRRKEGGYPFTGFCSYQVSKAAMIALCIVQARELASKGITVNACCPGYVDTDLTDHKGPLTVEQGTVTPIWLALSPDVPKNGGKFVSECKPKEWLLL